ncbi:glycosyltransferase [Actinosynnema pretiosum]|uniref:Glucosyl-3-phosphoglycerate synthase n=1 Tax=Actinosynnema pretiosum TaxID=42197 RepID=A0A290YZF4_9PSEU|nr:glycosyltransferase [Actinosynnema pretiosum]ATE52132.1 glycosyl transferase [Actinosynnema pretiosum]
MPRPDTTGAAADVAPSRRTVRRPRSVSVVVTAHGQDSTVGVVVEDALRGLEELGVPGEVVVVVGRADRTAQVALTSGASVVESRPGRGAAVLAGVAASRGDVVCLLDGDVRYFGEPPLVPLLVEPILGGLADACVSDLYWRPPHPRLWLHGFFAPLIGRLYPELLPKAGSTPWSGQRAALRALWPAELPDGATADLALLLHWNREAALLRPVLADDWTAPRKPGLAPARAELDLVVADALAHGRIDGTGAKALPDWFDAVQASALERWGDVVDPLDFAVAERDVLEGALRELRAHGL